MVSNAKYYSNVCNDRFLKPMFIITVCNGDNDCWSQEKPVCGGGICRGNNENWSNIFLLLGKINMVYLIFLNWFRYTLICVVPGCFLYERDYEGYEGSDINADPSDEDYGAGDGRRDSAEQCQRLCQSRHACEFFTYRPNDRSCWLKTLGLTRYQTGAISGNKFCGTPP